MAERWRRAECVGLDIMPLQHDHQLPNCTYLYIDVSTGMDAFADGSFDLIHLRQMLYCVRPSLSLFFWVERGHTKLVC